MAGATAGTAREVESLDPILPSLKSQVGFGQAAVRPLAVAITEHGRYAGCVRGGATYEGRAVPLATLIRGVAFGRGAPVQELNRTYPQDFASAIYQA
ncbi:hypothetical protein ABI_11310 [Asticcacaulis biprosthecium C19]|uniref:Uncharacterized protein n=1 Tax=Asticcacaulis biprosthecium C19 TaxID=715226 RepID=F4QHF7_9CAUL|nr:hypothetical protein [Asticcacaulis biprosthecium]EGF92694.1 hypothetical protein ABI_11310 [Asticcacaulis biprosthecium C19]